MCYKYTNQQFYILLHVFIPTIAELDFYFTSPRCGPPIVHCGHSAAITRWGGSRVNRHKIRYFLLYFFLICNPIYDKIDLYVILYSLYYHRKSKILNLVWFLSPLYGLWLQTIILHTMKMDKIYSIGLFNILWSNNLSILHFFNMSARLGANIIFA
jgi:hypothetical protein